MNAAVIIGVLIGILGFGAGMYFALRAAGLFTYLGGKKRSAIPAVDRETLRNRLLSLNDPAKPYCIRQGTESDLTAEWKFADATWKGILNKNGLKQTYRAMLLLDEGRKTVRCFEQTGMVQWSAGFGGMEPSFEYTNQRVGGSILYKKSRGKGLGFKDGSYGAAYDYSFDVDDIRGPIEKTVLESGWEWIPVSVKRHATYPSDRARPQDPPAARNFCTECGSRLDDRGSCARCGAAR